MESCVNENFFRISQEKQKRILSSALSEFSSKGFSNVKIKKIADAAQVSVGSLYKYFGSKRKLFLYLVGLGAEEIESLFSSVIEANNNFEGILEGLIRLVIVNSDSQQAMLSLYHGLSATGDSKLEQGLAEEVEGFTSRSYKTLIKAAAAEGRLKNNLDPDIAAFLLDNIIIQLQFSFSLDYFKKRLEMYAGSDIYQKKDFLISQCVNFMKNALLNEAYGPLSAS